MINREFLKIGCLCAAMALAMVLEAPDRAPERFHVHGQVIVLPG